MASKQPYRCTWCLGNDLYIAYHDNEWGVPLHDDAKLFELLTLEGAQAGLSWLTVLKRREGYRTAFNNFAIDKVSLFTDTNITKLLDDPGIIRNRLKVVSTINNAKAVRSIQKQFGSFDTYIWQFVGGQSAQHHYTKLSDLPSVDDTAVAMSKDLKKRGFNFVGPTICYAFMQSSGMVNDHVVACFRHQQLA